jgi:hypothetical protein
LRSRCSSISQLWWSGDSSFSRKSMMRAVQSALPMLQEKLDPCEQDCSVIGSA